MVRSFRHPSDRAAARARASRIDHRPSGSSTDVLDPDNTVMSRAAPNPALFRRQSSRHASSVLRPLDDSIKFQGFQCDLAIEAPSRAR